MLLLWLATGAVLLVLSAWRGGLNTVAAWLGVTGYPPAVLFAVATLFVLLVLLHYSTVISKLTDENVELAQRVALLEERVGRTLSGRHDRRAEDEDVALRRDRRPSSSRHPRDRSPAAGATSRRSRARASCSMVCAFR